jgi:DNA-binding transcriptional LysR family regulator
MNELENIRVFRKVVERGSISRAAADLGVGQPTVSKALRKLESRLETRLLLRSTRRVTPTEAGERYYQHCRAMLDGLDEAEADLSEEKVPRGTLRLHGPVVLGELFLGPLAVEFQRKYPKVRCDLVFLDTFVDLIAEGADLAIRLGAITEPGIVRRRLGKMQRIFVAAPRYLKQHGLPKEAADLAGHASVRFSGLASGDRVTAGETVVEMKPAFVANNAIVLRSALVGGLGIGLVTRWLVDEQLASGALVQVLPREPPPSLEVSAIFPSARFIPLRARLFVDFLMASMKDSFEQEG